MPAVSDAQRRWAFAVKGAAWARRHHFDNKGELPAHKADPRKAMRKRRRRKKGK